MDFTPTPEQAAARELAAQIFGDLSTPDRLAACGSGTDAALWKALCAAGLPGAVEETGLLGLVLMLEEQGRTTAQVPSRRPVCTACWRSARTEARSSGHGCCRRAERATGATSATDGGGGTGRLTGTVPVVPWLREATHVLVPDGTTRTLWLVRTDDTGVRRDPVETTAPWSAGRLTLDDAPAACLGRETTSPHPRTARAYDDVLALARTAFAGLQTGVCAGSLARAVSHTTTREQFGRPLATNQGVQLRAADAYMDTEAIRLTAYEAAWRRDAGLDAGPHALTAAWWASEAGTRVVHTGQHLHGGIGADVDHPVHRHFLWGRQLAGYLGAGAEALEELGELLISPTDREDREETG